MKQEPLPTNNKGFTLVEIVLALAVSSIATTVFIGGILYGSDALVSRPLRIQARLLASECLHVSRWLRDTEGLNLLTTGSHGLVATDERWELSGSEESNGPFTRTVTFEDIEEGVRDVSCTVAWESQFGTREVVLETQLGQWNIE